MAVPFPYRKSCRTGRPVLTPPGSDGRFSRIATIAPIKAMIIYKTELVISRLRCAEIKFIILSGLVRTGYRCSRRHPDQMRQWVAHFHLWRCYMRHPAITPAVACPVIDSAIRERCDFPSAVLCDIGGKKELPVGPGGKFIRIRVDILYPLGINATRLERRRLRAVHHRDE